LERLASLTEERLHLSRDLNDTSTSIAREILPSENIAERQERTRLSAYIKAQAKEIETLRSEIMILKRKDIPPIILSAPASSQLPLPPQTEDEALIEEVQLPPIRDAKP
jgi:hypothetical protein